MRHALLRALQLSHARCALLMYFRMLPLMKKNEKLLFHGVISWRAKTKLTRPLPRRQQDSMIGPNAQVLT